MGGGNVKKGNVKKPVSNSFMGSVTSDRGLLYNSIGDVSKREFMFYDDTINNK
jgi:hypothetical protein